MSQYCIVRYRNDYVRAVLNQILTLLNTKEDLHEMFVVCNCRHVCVHERLCYCSSSVTLEEDALPIANYGASSGLKGLLPVEWSEMKEVLDPSVVAFCEQHSKARTPRTKKAVKHKPGNKNKTASTGPEAKEKKEAKSSKPKKAPNKRDQGKSKETNRADAGGKESASASKPIQKLDRLKSDFQWHGVEYIAVNEYMDDTMKKLVIFLVSHCSLMVRCR